MALTLEAILYYLFVVDSSIYFVLSHTTGKFHKRKDHHIVKWVPLNKLFALIYIGHVVWVGISLHRLGIL
ncbi:TPA: hypothetical protein H1011_02770 [archaeon]|jgi:hypothetical protein|uniref:Uncharacterized protein n=1 Tax=Candidatus Undinarchaeum marinum TaxID=2756141 RepID=A0A832XLC8_9ARCH|nr:hypothetical protein [Candidatus Undinarchaeum marinum]